MLPGKLTQWGLDLDGESLRLSKIGLMFSWANVAGTSGSTELSLKRIIHFLSTTSGNGAFDLPDGVKGQVMILVLVDYDTTSAVITPDNFDALTAITMNANQEACAVVFDGTNWHPFATYGSPSIS